MAQLLLNLAGRSRSVAIDNAIEEREVEAERRAALRLNAELRRRIAAKMGLDADLGEPHGG